MSEINEILALDSDNRCYEKEILAENTTEVLPENVANNLNDARVNLTKNDKTTEDNIPVENNDEQYLAYQKHLEECIPNKSKLEQENHQLNERCRDLESRLGTIIKRYDSVLKDKDSMVMKYAVSEKAILDVKSDKEHTDKKYKELLRESEILQHKLTSMSLEKVRICQMLDNKCYDFKSSQQELERVKTDLYALETKLKWSQNSLRTEIDLRKDSDANVETLTAKLQESLDQIDQVKRDAQESIKTFYNSQDNRANALDQQVKEQQATLILLRHERDDREKQIKNLQLEFERLQSNQNDTLQENNTLSLKVQQLERERVEVEQKLRELRGCADQQKQDSADLCSKSAQLEQLKLQIQNEQEQLTACKEQAFLFKSRNAELESDMELCREREAEMLLFTQQLTDKNVRLQSEFTSMDTKVQQLTCEQTLLKRAAKEQETKVGILTNQLAESRTKFMSDIEEITHSFNEKTKLCEILTQEVADQKGENSVIKRKCDLSIKEINKELQQCRKKLEQNEIGSSSSDGSSTSLNVIQPTINSSEMSASEQVQVIQPDAIVNRQTLIEHIVKLQRLSARKSEKIDFLEEHVNTLVCELQRKTRLLQGYIMREQTGTLTSSKMDNNKANLAKTHGVMASVYGSRVIDSSLTLELSLDINRKLQAVLEDALLKNITLKENVDTLGTEIDRLNNLLKPAHS